MNESDYTTTLVVPQSPAEVFTAITDVRGWWSENIDGSAAAPGDEFHYQYQDQHGCHVQVTEAVPGTRVTWTVLDNYFAFVSDHREWTGTRIVFDIAKGAGQTRLVFTHRGLTPEFDCFDVCSNAWAFYVDTSLFELVTIGKGRPNPKEQQ